MIGKLLSATVAAAAILGMTQGAEAQPKKYVFALVPKNTNNPFFDQARDGCKKAERELKGAIECLYIGPGEHGGGEEQVQVINDLIAKKVDGIAVSPSSMFAVREAHAPNAVSGRPAALISCAIFSKPCFSGTTFEKRTRSMVKPGSAPMPHEYWLTPGMNRYPPSAAAMVSIISISLSLR